MGVGTGGVGEWGGVRVTEGTIESLSTRGLTGSRKLVRQGERGRGEGDPLRESGESRGAYKCPFRDGGSVPSSVLLLSVVRDS